MAAKSQISSIEGKAAKHQIPFIKEKAAIDKIPEGVIKSITEKIIETHYELRNLHLAFPNNIAVKFIENPDCTCFTDVTPIFIINPSGEISIKEETIPDKNGLELITYSVQIATIVRRITGKDKKHKVARHRIYVGYGTKGNNAYLFMESRKYILESIIAGVETQFGAKIVNGIRNYYFTKVLTYIYGKFIDDMHNTAVASGKIKPSDGKEKETPKEGTKKLTPRQIKQIAVETAYGFESFDELMENYHRACVRNDYYCHTLAEKKEYVSAEFVQQLLMEVEETTEENRELVYVNRFSKSKHAPEDDGGNPHVLVSTFGGVFHVIELTEKHNYASYKSHIISEYFASEILNAFRVKA